MKMNQFRVISIFRSTAFGVAAQGLSISFYFPFVFNIS